MENLVENEFEHYTGEDLKWRTLHSIDLDSLKLNVKCGKSK
jgi:hypothetical protein